MSDYRGLERAAGGQSERDRSAACPESSARDREHAVRETGRSRRHRRRHPIDRPHRMRALGAVNVAVVIGRVANAIEPAFEGTLRRDYRTQ